MSSLLRGPFSLLLRLSVICVLVSQPEPWGQTQTVCLARGRSIPVRTLTQPPCGRELSLRKCPESWRWWGWFLLPPFFMSQTSLVSYLLKCVVWGQARRHAGGRRGFWVCVVVAQACQPLFPLSLSLSPLRCSPAVCYPLGHCQVPL